jgi:phospholipid transport system transporter-binding protein
MALQHVDTAGLAWLLHQLSQAKQLGIHVTLRNMPQQLTSLAEVSAVFDLLPVA